MIVPQFSPLNNLNSETMNSFVPTRTRPITFTSVPNLASNSVNVANFALNFLVSSHPIRALKLNHLQKPPTSIKSQSPSNPESNEKQEDDPDEQVQDLVVPQHWLLPSKAAEESEWLRVALHKWLDDEYCPEATNAVISRVAAQSYYKSLIEKRTDLGEILLKMALELESISYRESFHGAFSSANAAVNLIAQRIEQS